MKMTLDEAIKHAEEVSNANERLCKTVRRDMQLSDYGKCAAEHRQLAEWLKELRVYRKICHKEHVDAFDKARAEIEKLQTYKMFIGEKTVYVERDDVLAIIDKYKSEE